MASDFGDAPDTGLGVGIANYETLFANGGASHVIDTTQSTLFLGSRVDAEADGAASAKANGDDLYVTPNADDEDGVIDPDVDLLLTAGAIPQARVRATNTTGNSAMLYGWIDVNRDGVFDNTTERASIAVPMATVNGIFTLNFPTVPLNATGGKTYARFRLSTDTAAANPNGTASDGEVEDYQATVTRISSGQFDTTKSTRIADSLLGGPVLQDNDSFGSAVATLGDLDGTGKNFVAVGAPGRGVVYLMPVNANGSAGTSIVLASGVGGMPSYLADERFGSSLAAIGDINGDGVPDLAVGAPGDDTGGINRGAIYLLRMNTNGTVNGFTKIASGTVNLPSVGDFDAFGSSIASVPDLDGDGIAELAIGSTLSDIGGTDRGSVSLLFMNADTTIKSSIVIASGVSGGPTLADGDLFGASIASVGDLNGDSVNDIAVGAISDDYLSTDAGAFYLLFMNSGGTVLGTTKVANRLNGGPMISSFDRFGSSITAAGDLDGDGTFDLSVGSTGFNSRGDMYSLLMNPDGSVKSFRNLVGFTSSGITLNLNDDFAASITSVGDLDGDGVPEFVVGSPGDDNNGTNRGAVRVINLRNDNVAPVLSIRRQTPLASTTNASSLVFRISFDEDVFNVDATDFTVSGSTATIQSISPINSSTFDVLVSGGNLGSFTGTVGIAVAASRDISDRVGNLLEALTPAVNETYSVDSAVPVAVSIVRLIPSAILTSKDAVRFRVTFNEPVANVDTSDFIVTGTTANMTITGSSSTYDVTLSGGDLSNLTGTIGLNFAPTQDIADAATNRLPTVEPAIDETFSIVQSTLDFGDAPDPGIGTGVGNYQTSLADNGPRHTIVAGLRLGINIDEEPDGLTADDGPNIAPGVDDEDGSLESPVAWNITIGSSPTARLQVSNTTGTAATLYGWIDLNRNGIFDNTIERASVLVPTGTTNGVAVLNFQTISPGFAPGLTQARFRLSTDNAASNPIGFASDGEVEDHTVRLLRATDGTADSSKGRKLEHNFSGPLFLTASDSYGSSIAAIGDLNGDGIIDLAVGARLGDSFGLDSGAVYVHRMNSNGSLSVPTSTAIVTPVSSSDFLGTSIAAIGDFNGNGVPDFVIGAPGANLGGTDRGAVYVSLLASTGTSTTSTRIGHLASGGPTLASNDLFGTSVSSIGDFDSDGVTDIAVGAVGDDTGGADRGAIYILRLNSDRTVKSSTKIANGLSGGPTLVNSDRFGSSIANLGDIDADGITDLAVGASRDDTSGTDRGAIYILRMNADGTVKASTKIASNLNGGPTLGVSDQFGYSATGLGDMNADGVPDLVVGAPFDNTGAFDAGAIYLVNLNSNGTARSFTKIARGLNGGPSTLAASDRFGTSIASIGDFDGDGVVDLAVGADGNDVTSASDSGAVHLIYLKREISAPSITSIVRQTPATNPTGADTLTFRVTFGEDVLNVTGDDFTVTGSTATVTSVTPVSNQVYDLTVSGGDLTDLNGVVGLDISVSANIVDRANNLIALNEPSIDETYTVDNNKPTLLSIARLVPTYAVTSAEVLRFRATFSEPVTGVDAADFTPVGTTSALFVNAISSTVYHITLSVSPFLSRTIGLNVASTVSIFNSIGNEVAFQEPSIDETFFHFVHGNDFGDAPDLGVGTGLGNYRTNLNDNGPSHSVTSMIAMGTFIDDEADGQLSDDAGETFLVNNDEDGLVDPLADLTLIQGQNPIVRVRARNNNVFPGTLYGWIDIDRNGTFDNATERTSVNIPSGSDGTFNLLFPRLPLNASVGTTFARFRLSTDSAAAESFGFALDGEVEDYQAVITAAPASVADRRVFYNRSTSSIFGNGSDNPINAIDPTKQALLPGQTTTAANFTNYSRGLNGIVIDVANVANLSAISATSFQFATWSSFPDSTPNFVTINPTVTVSTFAGGGLNGSDRVKLEFANNAIQNAWLRVTMLADANTGLAANDVFYFGNARFDVTPTSPFPSQQVTINAFDVNTLRARQGQNPGVISNIFDVDRNGVVNAFDTNAVRGGQGVSSLRSFTAPSSLQMGLASLKSSSTVASVDSLFADTSWLDAFQIGTLKNRHQRRG